VDMLIVGQNAELSTRQWRG